MPCVLCLLASATAFAVAREGGEVREVVRDGGAVGEHLILQLLPD